MNIDKDFSFRLYSYLMKYYQLLRILFPKTINKDFFIQIEKDIVKLQKIFNEEEKT